MCMYMPDFWQLPALATAGIAPAPKTLSPKRNPLTKKSKILYARGNP